MKQKLVYMAGAVLVAGMATADTVAWWRFEDAEPGTTANSGVVSESIGGSNATSYYIWSNKIEQVNNEYRPAFGPVLGLALYDPVACTTNSNSAAMKFITARGGVSPNTNAGRAYYGGALKVDDGNKLYARCTGAVTVEAFVCTTGGVYNTFAPIIGCLTSGSWTGEKWAIYMENSGIVAVRFNGSVWYSGSTADKTGTVKINDGLWHHVAITWDGSTIRVYVDYEMDKKASDKSDRAYSKSGTIDYAGTATWMGGYATYDPSNGGRKFPGLIDEVRVSNGALTPDQFLRFVPAAPAGDGGEALHLGFDGNTARMLEDGEVLADAVGGIPSIYCAVSGAAASVYDTSEKAGTAIANGLYDDAPIADTSSLRQSVNANDKSNYVKAEAAAVGLFPEGVPVTTSLNYTVEAFFKANSSGQPRKTVLKFGTKYLPAHVITGDSGNEHQMQFCYRKGSSLEWTSGGYTPSDRPYDDGGWHHVAFVSDASNGVVRTYYDYALVAEASDVYVPVSWNESLFIGSKENGGGQFFDGWIDDVRITKRVLRPEEFLTTHPVGSAPVSLFLADMENNYSFTFIADGCWSVLGSGLANTSAGNAPTFESTSPGMLLMDGTNGTKRVANDFSVKFNKSYVEFPPSPLYEQRACTVEFWARFTGFVDNDGEHKGDYANLPYHAGILRFNRATGTTFDWYFYRQNRNAKGTQVAVREASGGVAYLAFPFDRDIADGKWHHYALTFASNEANTETIVSVYDDFRLVASQTCAGIYAYSGGHKLQFGMGSSNPPFILGYINSVRFSRGVLSPDRFLGRIRPGPVVIFK